MESIVIHGGRACNGLIHQPAVKIKDEIQVDNRSNIPPGIYQGKMAGWLTSGANGWNKVQIIFELIGTPHEGVCVSCYRNVHPLSTKPGLGCAFDFRITQDLALELALLFPHITNFNELTLDLLFGIVVELKIDKVTRNHAKKVRPESVQYSKVVEVIRIIDENMTRQDRRNTQF